MYTVIKNAIAFPMTGIAKKGKRFMRRDVDFDDYLREQLRNPKVKQAYDCESSKLEAAVVISQAREAARLTQRALANKAGIPQATDRFTKTDSD
ncbi:helix-turn-helix domain-containing protein [Lacticaseibacillus chiayiensis]|uniref:Helix-turn-helix domain-containing protein n=2 Tax=Lacticaseibacillus chiayiensis TaxID=2100821 RepID=A0ABY6H600_9LACO|nr:helix-turn-helix transcriptional regulator [Lacticaseibacillus chiayiensis]QVI35013.1 helix-turn-helix transcriptional regulator [Lacticaseibacillus chiayiensis]UYN56793.1 helix-turn-helix domain-containing protein [Lacticaseibacillus chiayiensis]